MWRFVSARNGCPTVEGHLSRAEFSCIILGLCLTKTASGSLLFHEGGDEHPAQTSLCAV